MLIKVLSNKIGSAWEIVKPAVIKADDIPKGYEQEYLNELLHNLLSNKAQLFIRTNTEQTEVKAIIITRIMFDSILKQKYLWLQTYFAFAKSGDAEWAENMDTAIKFAKQEDCKYITCTSSNEKIIKLGKFYGFTERCTQLDFDLGGA